jgi:hypothetical protein
MRHAVPQPDSWHGCADTLSLESLNPAVWSTIMTVTIQGGHMALEVNTAILDVICEQRFERLQTPLALNMNEWVGEHVTLSLCPSVDPGV